MNRKIIIQRGEKEDYFMHEFEMESGPGMVVLDAIHEIQANDAPDLAVRWNCKAGKCGSCSAEVNGVPKLMCMTRMSDYDPSEPLVIKPMKAFPVVKDLVSDVSWNYEVNKKILPYQHPDTDDPRMFQEDVDRVQEFRKCIECFLGQVLWFLFLKETNCLVSTSILRHEKLIERFLENDLKYADESMDGSQKYE